MYQNKACTLVDLPDDRRAIEINGSLRRRRTWAVMLPSMKLDLWERVCSQVQGVDYDENLSPVAMLKSVGIMLALVVFFDYEILQMDVKTSFLTSFCKKELYVIQSKFLSILRMLKGLLALAIRL